jgi:hypothetical protein
MNHQDTPENILVDVDAESQRNLLSDAGKTPAGTRRFIATTASMSSFLGPFGPGRCSRWCETICGIFVSSVHGARAAE